VARGLWRDSKCPSPSGPGPCGQFWRVLKSHQKSLGAKNRMPSRNLALPPFTSYTGSYTTHHTGFFFPAPHSTTARETDKKKASGNLVRITKIVKGADKIRKVYYSLLAVGPTGRSRFLKCPRLVRRHLQQHSWMDYSTHSRYFISLSASFWEQESRTTTSRGVIVVVLE
jgi:hypothetical protein